MLDAPTTKLITCNSQIDLTRKYKWRDFVNGGDGFLYGIPDNAPKVVRFSPIDKSMEEIGPYLGDEEYKYRSGIRAGNGSIYCIPHGAKHFLKITPSTEGGDAKVQILDKTLSINNGFSWLAGALAKDGCIYYMPFTANRILKLDPANGDSLSLVAKTLEEKNNVYGGAVLGNDGCIYGIPSFDGYQVIKFNPVDCSIIKVGDYTKRYETFEGGVLGADGNIYAANRFGQVLKIDTSASNFTIIGSKLYSGSGYRGWGQPVLGADDCIYFPPYAHNRALQFNPRTQNVSQVGDSFESDQWKWEGAVLGSDGFIYCIPYNSKQILQIDARHVNEQILEFIQNSKRFRQENNP